VPSTFFGRIRGLRQSHPGNLKGPSIEAQRCCFAHFVSSLPLVRGVLFATDRAEMPYSYPCRCSVTDQQNSANSDSFDLWDLRVEVIGPQETPVYCGARLGDYFELHGEMLLLPPGQGFSIYSLAALLPLLPAKQRATHPHDWMSTDAEVACPDPHCPTRFRIIRTAKRSFRHGDVTAVPLSGKKLP